MVSENNNEMMDSYTMIDPSGRFFTNKKGFKVQRTYSKIGIKSAYKQLNYNYEEFQGGLYEQDQ